MNIKLFGDHNIAASWIPWAKSRLVALKTMMSDCGQQASTKRYSLEDVEVVVRSILGMDEIRITATAGGPGLYICGQVIKDDGMWAWMLEKRGFSGSSIWRKIFNATTNPAYANGANGIALDKTTGDIYVCGNVHVEIPGFRYWKVEKRSSSGSLIWESAVTTKGEAYSVAVTDDAVYVAGHVVYIPGGAPPLWDWRIEKRSKKDGTILWQQVLSVVVPPHYDSGAYSVDATADFVFVCGQMVNTPFVECLNASDGSVVWTKQLTTDGGTAVTGGWYNSVKYFNGALYVAGTRKFATPNIYNWKIERREIAAGTIVWTQTYSNDGLPEAAHHAQAMDLAIEGNYLFACGYDGGNNPAWRVEQRNLEDGTLIWSQRPTWTLSYPYSSEPVAIAVRNGVSYAGGWKAETGVVNTQYYLESYKADGTFLKKMDMTKYPQYSQISDLAIGEK